MNKTSVWIFIGIFVAYFIFTSGLWYWASRCEITKNLITPYSFALSAEERGFTGVATKSDMDCVKWLLGKSDKDLKIAGDSNVIFLLTGYFVTYTEDGRIASIENFADVEESRYLFLSEWNIKNGKYILCSDVGLRTQYWLIVEDGTISYEIYDAIPPSKRVTKVVPVVEVFRSGNARIYEK